MLKNALEPIKPRKQMLDDGKLTVSRVSVV